MNLNKLEQGGEVEDQATVLRRQQQECKTQLASIKAKRKRVQDEITRNSKLLDQTQMDLTNKVTEADSAQGKQK